MTEWDPAAFFWFGICQTWIGYYIFNVSIMNKKEERKKNKKIKRKEIMAKILLTISEALKEYATVSERMAKKIRKASKELSNVLVKDKD